MRRDPGKAWSAPEVSSELGTPPESTAMRLFLLASNGIVVFDGSGGLPRYRCVTDPAVAAMLDELALASEENREALLGIAGGAPSRDPLRSFADAFKLKK
jgi:hypothetical protein